MYFKMTRATVTVAGGAVALCLGSVPAALAAPAQDTTFVPCNADALHTAIEDASSGDTLYLAPGCTYYLPEALPEIMTELTIVGYHATLTRARDAGGFSLLKVGCEAGDLTVINVNFTDGGGYDVDGGGAIDVKDGTLHVTGGIFTDNGTDDVGGAIYNEGDMTVNNATFTDNLAHYGGAIENDHDAWVDGSTFTWNKAPTAANADLYHSYGGAIYNDHDLYLDNDGFLGNSTGGYGGAIYTDHELLAAHITVTANAAGNEGGGIYNDDDTTLFGSTVFDNQPNNCSYVDGCF
jgi:Chlamydia polymorphic membrane protein (Chlamydia_PMP) repeat